ncbi:MAG: hypothetical protein HFJ65_08545 [Eggerthellaceae bacterium]|nr:hypothetical protein [Eggerthellaceae bacterium]
MEEINTAVASYVPNIEIPDLDWLADGRLSSCLPGVGLIFVIFVFLYIFNPCKNRSLVIVWLVATLACFIGFSELVFDQQSEAKKADAVKANTEAIEQAFYGLSGIIPPNNLAYKIEPKGRIHLYVTPEYATN